MALRPPPILEVRSVTHLYGATAVLPPLDFALAEDEHCAVVGPSGSGKSTLLHILAGILRPTAGEVSLRGEPLHRGAARSDRWRAQRIGMIPQRLHLLQSLSARDNVRLSLYLSGRGAADTRVDALLRDFGLEDRARSKPSALSVGEQQRVAIARAIVAGKQLLLADEPTSSLDDDNARLAVDRLLAGARLAGALLVVATHDARIRPRFARVVELGAHPR